MAGSAHVTPPIDPSQGYQLGAEQYRVLCLVRNELHLLAAFATRRAAREPAQADYHAKLAQCFGSLEHRLAHVVSALDTKSGEKPETRVTDL